MVLKTHLQVAFEQGVVFGQSLGTKSSVVKETRKVANLENLSGFRELFGFSQLNFHEFLKSSGGTLQAKGHTQGSQDPSTWETKKNTSLWLFQTTTPARSLTSCPALTCIVWLLETRSFDPYRASMQHVVLHLAFNFLNGITILRV